MLAAARWVLAQTKYRLISALAQHPDYQLLVVGHSMGGGTAALLTMMVREKIPELAAARCYAIACPAVMTLELAGACSGAVTTLVHGADIVPTFSIGSVDALREEVTRSSWFADFQSDTRQRLYRALSTTVATATSAGGATLVAGCSGAGRWTARNILSPASKPFRSCWGPAPPGVGGPRRGGAAAAGGPGGGSGEAQPLLAGRGQAERYWQQQAALQGADGRPTNGRASPRPWGTAATGPGGGSGDEGLADVGGGEVSGAAGGVPVGPLLPSGPELEAALQQCLAAVEARELGPQAAGALAAPLASEPFDRGLGGALPVSTRGGGGVGGASPPRGRTPVGGGVVGSVRAALVGKQRPAAPGKKDDDRAGAPPFGAAPGPADGADEADSSAAAPFSAAVTLRRRGWTWQVLGPEAGGDGGAGAGGGWALEGGGVAGSMVQYVGRTSRLAAAAAGSLLRGGSVVLNACTPPTPPLAAGAGAGSAQQQQDGGSSGSRLGMGMGWLADFPGSPFHSGGGAGSSDGGQRGAPHAPDDGGGGDQGSDGSEGALDPDLDAEGGLAGDEEADAHELERPEVRQSISAVVATLVTADTGAGDAAARAEASAAEELLLEAADGGPGGGSSGGGSSTGQLLGAAGASPTRGGWQQHDGGNGSPPARGRGPDVASGDGGGATEGGAPSRSDDPRMVRRQMYPAGRILHLMPAHALRPPNAGDTQAQQQQQQQQQQRQSSEQQQPSRRTSQAGAVGGSGDYVLLEVPRREVYGRLRLCRSMIRDHFIPAYLRGLDAVAARLEAQLAEGGDSA
ncbi:hypothetical protein MNEG_3418 [Monoraphidium neglectum]|uniref:Fungal lipase-type domain-containing protein n=1 Tax=Monoraphidium neglectum TaxID=145388 RepID=A0A0D2MPC5_9CHLO|nr:hypothetical protein MNEG_3418 [Monoraphidium neglectum]KIZ04540.1 hypothetical protein MNEG_3418 [Monoraphidium neglectum]|eukprot:XP_013903559.1 hypothetical protein MNEG_3418 [Monoraphidium neglectum]